MAQRAMCELCHVGWTSDTSCPFGLPRSPARKVEESIVPEEQYSRQGVEHRHALRNILARVFALAGHLRYVRSTIFARSHEGLPVMCTIHTLNPQRTAEDARLDGPCQSTVQSARREGAAYTHDTLTRPAVTIQLDSAGRRHIYETVPRMHFTFGPLIPSHRTQSPFKSGGCGRLQSHRAPACKRWARAWLMRAVHKDH
ncbi:hypothetical protein C8Q70DRAFT_141952 [Cubamyces menziesii]|nr:hypothetical protein C8Q70DRAFT_141952 [Cubamyces menziesii]